MTLSTYLAATAAISGAFEDLPGIASVGIDIAPSMGAQTMRPNSIGCQQFATSTDAMSHFMSHGPAGISWKRPELLGTCCKAMQHEKGRRIGRPLS